MSTIEYTYTYIRHIIEQLRLPKRDMNFVHVYY